MKRWLIPLLAGLLALQCGGDDTGETTETGTDTIWQTDTGRPPWGDTIPGADLSQPGLDTTPGQDTPAGQDTPTFPDTPTGQDTPPSKGKLGDLCEENTDCEGGYCVPSDIGYVCTRQCFDDCPEGWQCKAVAGTEPDVVFVCMPSMDMVCRQQGVCVAGAQETEPCGNCGLSTRTCQPNCQWGPWSDCVGEGSCVPGQTEHEDCGNCGVQERTCGDDCLWSQWSDCSGAGECADGDVETQPCGNCGEKSRTCTGDCNWSDWTACQGEGPCEPGDTEFDACGLCGSKQRTCDEECSWSAWGQCVDDGQCSPGEVETKACGNCGEKQRSCTNQCLWSEWGVCEGQGPCSPGQTKTEPCGNCGTQYYECTNSCAWTISVACADQGCQPGSTQPCNLCGTKICNASCSWGTCDIGFTDGYEENDWYDDAFYLAEITDNNGSSQQLVANINPSNDTDFYAIHIKDTTFHAIDPKFTLTVPPGQTYWLCAYYECDKTSNIFTDCMLVTGTDSLELEVKGCTNIWDWDDDSGTATIEIDPNTDGSCSNYTLLIEA